MREVNVVLALGLNEDLVASVREVSPRLRITTLSWAQRRAYRGGRPIWYAYAEERRPDEESEEEAQASLATVLTEMEVLFTSPLMPPDLGERAPNLRWVQLPPGAMRAKVERTWRPYLAEELHGKTIGIIGLGAIGGYVAKLAKADGMRVLAIRRSAAGRKTGHESGDPNGDELLPPSDPPYPLSQADYVVIAVPLTAAS